MSDILTIDTGAGLPQEQRLEPLPLFDENFPMLKQTMPEYSSKLPNQFISNLIKQMRMTMKKFGGIGLSANQCGVTARMFIIGTDEYELVCINPRVLAASADVMKTDEGCLSYPGLYLKIDRPNSIQVEFTDENGQVQQTMLEGLSARCFLHELDHMNGKKFIEYVGPVALQMARKKQDKLMKKVIRNQKKK